MKIPMTVTISFLIFLGVGCKSTQSPPIELNGQFVRWSHELTNNCRIFGENQLISYNGLPVRKKKTCKDGCRLTKTPIVLSVVLEDDMSIKFLSDSIEWKLDRLEYSRCWMRSWTHKKWSIMGYRPYSVKVTTIRYDLEKIECVEHNDQWSDSQTWLRVIKKTVYPKTVERRYAMYISNGYTDLAFPQFKQRMKSKLNDKL